MRVLFILLISSCFILKQENQKSYMVVEVDSMENYFLLRCLEKDTDKKTVILFEKESLKESVIDKSLVGCKINVGKLLNLSVGVKGDYDEIEVSFENKDIWKGAGNVDLYLSEDNVITVEKCEE